MVGPAALGARPNPADRGRSFSSPCRGRFLLGNLALCTQPEFLIAARGTAFGLPISMGALSYSVLKIIHCGLQSYRDGMGACRYALHGNLSVTAALRAAANLDEGRRGDALGRCPRGRRGDGTANRYHLAITPTDAVHDRL